MNLINERRVETFAEVAVWKGEFAQALLQACSTLERYYMIDPWRHLDTWNKPANVARSDFDAIFVQAVRNTEFADRKRVVLRGQTVDMARRIPDGYLDASYIDGDHTLRGITIDLVSLYRKARAGDDFTLSIWQHPDSYEPTLVFPFAVHIAEAVDQTIYGLPYNQFVITKLSDDTLFRFVDFTGHYPSTAL